MAEFNVNALQAMIHHVTRKYAMHPHKLGSVKLYKVLWWAEARSLRLRGEQIAGETVDTPLLEAESERTSAALRR